MTVIVIRTWAIFVVLGVALVKIAMDLWHIKWLRKQRDVDERRALLKTMESGLRYTPKSVKQPQVPTTWPWKRWES